MCEQLVCKIQSMDICTCVLCMFACVSRTKSFSAGLQWWYVNESLQVLLRLKDLLRPYNGACDLIQFDSIRNIYRDKGYRQTCSCSGGKMIKFAYKETLWGEKEKESSDWSLAVCLKVPGCLCLAEKEKKKINIMSPNCLCVSLSSSLSPLSPPSVSFSLSSRDSQTAASVQPN